MISQSYHSLTMLLCHLDCDISPFYLNIWPDINMKVKNLSVEEAIGMIHI